jgi:hypothetical protein
MDEDQWKLWRHGLALCRALHGEHLEDFQCVAHFLLVFFQTCQEEARVSRQHKIMERDGWRCAVPGCTSRRNLHEHHIIFRSAGGSDEEENLVTVCAAHHTHGIHEGRIACQGQAPHNLCWVLGARADGTPHAEFVGEYRVL